VPRAHLEPRGHRYMIAIDLSEAQIRSSCCGLVALFLMSPRCASVQTNRDTPCKAGHALDSRAPFTAASRGATDRILQQPSI
jgi:hypothetical protein